MDVLKLSDGVGDARYGVVFSKKKIYPGSDECAITRMPLKFNFLASPVSNFYFGVKTLLALLKPPWTGTSPAKVSIILATCWASQLLMF